MMETPRGSAIGAGARLNALLATARLEPLDAGTTAQFEAYLALLLRWNAKMNLTAIRDQEEILARHFVESIACARALPAGIGTLLDYGSGAGFPGIPIALCRPEIAVTLAESQGKKAAFLREAVRVVGIAARVYEGRAESLTERFDCVALRAVDRMAGAVRVACRLIQRDGWLALLATTASIAALQGATGPGLLWEAPACLPGAGSRVLLLGQGMGQTSIK